MTKKEKQKMVKIYKYIKEEYWDQPEFFRKFNLADEVISHIEWTLMKMSFRIKCEGYTKEIKQTIKKQGKTPKENKND